MPKIEIELSELLAALRPSTTETVTVGTGGGGGGYVAKTMPIGSDMIGKYVIVRCRDAGVHAGILLERQGRECVLAESRRLWYWKPANGAAFLSGVATEGLHKNSKVGARIKITLTENCEIIECTDRAQASIEKAPDHESK